VPDEDVAELGGESALNRTAELTSEKNRVGIDIRGEK
jgi:hypothetical protein